jgi:ElaB/YqjD/DUF883 family membrane-anchored ribosome-binding protein
MANTKRIENDAASMADHASTLVKDVKELGSAAKRTVADRADALRETANDYLDQGRMKAREAGEHVQNKVVEKPITSVLIAAIVGFFVGILWVRR